MKRLLSLLTVFLFALASMAQNLAVTSFELLETDLTANLEGTTVLDQNGQKCALIRILTTQKGFSFDVGSLGVQKVDDEKVGEVWVYVPAGVKKLDIHHPQLGSIVDYAFPIVIRSARTYRMRLEVAEVRTTIVMKDLNTYFTMKVTPSNAMVLIDDELQQVEADGTLMLLLKQGEHTYDVQASGYTKEQGTFTLGSEKLRKDITLQSVMAQLTLNCPTEGAALFVNEEQKGTGTWNGALKAGTYRIEARKDGHHSHNLTVELVEREQKTISIPALVARVGQLNVSYKPMDSEVFIDGKRVGTSPDVFKDVIIGDHKVEIKKAGYTTDTKTVTIEEGQTAGLTGTLKEVATIADAVATGQNAFSFTVNGVTFYMVAVEGGTFTMGSTDSDAGSDEKPTHNVTLSSYYIGQTEVTQELWKAVMGSNPSAFKGNNFPVERVSWDDCLGFIKKINKLTKKKFRLPTEAEWEYASRGGNQSKGYKYSGSNDIASVAWHNYNSRNKTHPVASKQPNELGMYDMSGNVAEWCQDKYGPYSTSNQTNPIGKGNTGKRVSKLLVGAFGANTLYSEDTFVYRGGGWNNHINECRSSTRNKISPKTNSNFIGIRLALSD